MTRIDKSPEMLDAEAANRAAPLDPPQQTMIRWQAALDAEPSLRLTGRHPALLVDGENRAMIEATQVGVDFTEAMIEWVDASFPVRPNDPKAPLGARGRNPVHDGLILWERNCRKNHNRWADHRGRPVCADIAWAVIRDRTSLLWAAEFSGVSYPRAERMLRSAVKFMRGRQERWMDNEEVILPARSPSEWMVAPHVHSHPPDTTLDDCPQCMAA